MHFVSETNAKFSSSMIYSIFSLRFSFSCFFFFSIDFDFDLLASNVRLLIVFGSRRTFFLAGFHFTEFWVSFVKLFHPTVANLSLLSDRKNTIIVCRYYCYYCHCYCYCVGKGEGEGCLYCYPYNAFCYSYWIFMLANKVNLVYTYRSNLQRKRSEKKTWILWLLLELSLAMSKYFHLRFSIVLRINSKHLERPISFSTTSKYNFLAHTLLNRCFLCVFIMF